MQDASEERWLSYPTSGYCWRAHDDGKAENSTKIVTRVDPSPYWLRQSCSYPLLVRRCVLGSVDRRGPRRAPRGFLKVCKMARAGRDQLKAGPNGDAGTPGAMPASSPQAPHPLGPSKAWPPGRTVERGCTGGVVVASLRVVGARSFPLCSHGGKRRPRREPRKRAGGGVRAGLCSAPASSRAPLARLPPELSAGPSVRARALAVDPTTTAPVRPGLSTGPPRKLSCPYGVLRQEGILYGTSEAALNHIPRPQRADLLTIHDLAVLHAEWACLNCKKSDNPTWRSGAGLIDRLMWDTCLW